MIRVLFIARYRDATMDRKIALMAQNTDLTIWQIRPSSWQDELLQIEQFTSDATAWRQIALPLIGRPNDPHRTIYRTLTFALRRFHPHIIHAEEEPDSLSALQITLARALWAPQARLILYTWQNINRPKRWYVKSVMRATLCAADSILCANREAVEILRQQGYRGHAMVLPAIGVDTRVFAPCADRLEKRRGFVVGYIGRLVPEKGVDLLIEATPLIGGNIRLLIMGSGPYRPTLEEIARIVKVSDQVDFIPPMPPSQVARQMCALGVLVLPSRTTSVWKEQFGRVLVEAMACKVPVIGSDSGAIPEVIGDAGLIFPEGNAAALADCLRRLIESPTLRHDLAERGYTRANRLYSQEHIAEQTADFYRQIMKWESPQG